MKKYFAGIAALIILVTGGYWVVQMKQAGTQTNVPISVVPTLTPTGFFIASPEIQDGGMIPALYTCDGENISPPLSIGSPPEFTKTLALIVDDIDTPMRTWVHWIVWNIPAAAQTITANTSPVGASAGVNGFGKNGYGGPCQPSGRHRYVFRLYALDMFLSLPRTAGKDELIRAMNTHVLKQTEFTGVYIR